MTPSTSDDLMTRENADLLTEKLIQSYPDLATAEPHTTAVLRGQLSSILTGKPKADGRAMLSPESGVPGTCMKLTAYNVNKWLEKRHARNMPSRYGTFERIAEATHKPDQLEAKRRHIIAAAHAVSSEKGVKLSDLLDQAAEAAEEGSEIRHLLERSANRFRHLPAPKYRNKLVTDPVMAYGSYMPSEKPVEGG